jgi:uncharacterized RDD family membrane protein YckC
MKGIEIKTAQNVFLEYELATLRDRILAFLLDLAAIALAITVFSMIFGLLPLDGFMRTATLIFLFCIFIFYSLLFEVLNNGQSLGKKVLNIRVINITGEKATFYDYAGRWVFRMIDIYLSLGAIASMLIASSSKAQRIGDMASNTAVIKLVPSVNLYLNDILKIQSRETYQPVYLQAKQLVEEDVILIKNAIDRFKKYDNNAHMEAIIQLTARLKSVLEIKENVPDNLRFLQTIINDYIVLTR